MITDLISFFQDRGLHDVVKGLREDLKANKRGLQDGILKAVRKAVVESDKYHMARKSTNERNNNRRAEFELMPKHESEAIMENLMQRMVNRPTKIQEEKEKVLNKQIEKVFELDAFQKMVENADHRSLKTDIMSTK